MPFRWLKTAYRCFYCYDIFEDAADLKRHQSAHINNKDKENTLNNYCESSIFVDISSIGCRLCEESVTNLPALIDHLVSVHDVAYDKDVGNSFVAFQLEGVGTTVSCSTCAASFNSFGLLLTHTNKDHKLTTGILCEVCGLHFKDASLLRIHIKTIHEQTCILCTVCGEKFETKNKLLTHERNKHNKRYKCLVCPETFQSHYKRSWHMASEHKNRSEIKCLHCPKTFVFRSTMMSHLRLSHLNERNHVCGVCGWKTYTNNKLRDHMYKHSGERNFKCEVCDKAFTTKKIMRSHFVRMHKNKAVVFDGGAGFSNA